MMVAAGSMHAALIFETDFNKMKLGGDAIGGRQGVLLDLTKTPWDITSEPGKLTLPENPVYETCAFTKLAINFFSTAVANGNDNNGAVSDSYKALRDFADSWTGQRIYEQPGYVTFGHSSGDAWLTTPPLSNISGTKRVILSFKVARRKTTNANTQVTVSISGGGKIIIDNEGVASTRVSGGVDLTVGAEGVWIQKALVIDEATSTTRIKFENTLHVAGSRNFSLDDVIITTAQTYHVSAANGSDDNPGTSTQPFKTISKAAEAACPGDTIFVMEGVYRERVSPSRGGTGQAPIVYRGEPGKRVFIKGSDVYDKPWQAYSERISSADLNQMQFTDDVYRDAANPFKVISAGNPYGITGKHTLGQVFVEGAPYVQKESQAAMTQPGSWWYHSPENRVYVHFRQEHSTESLVEITTRRRIFAPHTRGLGYIHVMGFIMEHCGNQFPTEFWSNNLNAQAGAFGLRSGSHWLVKNNIIRYAAGIGLDCGIETDASEDIERFSQPPVPSPTGNIIEYNYLLNNGCIGIMGKGTTDMMVRGNIVMHNNTRQHDLSEEGGMKFHNMTNGVITGNYIAENKTFGVWLDNRYYHTRVTGNFITGNKKGVKVEMGNYGFGAVLIDHNVLMNNVENQYYSHDASGVLLVNNLIAGTRNDNFGQGIYVRQVTDRTNSKNNAFYNNIVCNNDYAYDILYPAEKGGEQRFLGNLYDRDNTTRMTCINNMTNTPPGFSAAKFRQQVSTDIGGGNLPDVAFKNGNNAGSIRAVLNPDEWQRFWSGHTIHNDSDAEIMTGISAVYDSESRTVRLNVPSETSKRINSRWDNNYKNIYKLTEEASYPGPFDNIHAGLNEYAYQGLPAVETDRLPPLPDTPVTSLHGAGEKPKAGVIIYPNPAGDYLHFYCEETVLAITVFNLQGAVVRSTAYISGRPVSLAGLLPGMYLVCFTTRENRITNKFYKSN
jgi:hypothetical protein